MLEAVDETAGDLHRLRFIDEREKQKFDALCLESLPVDNSAHSLLSSFDLLATAPRGVAKLRELILALAVRGKLVPQDSADEPARVLLEKVHAEKARLIAEGKIKRDRALTPMGDSERPFELPQSWAWTCIPDLCAISGGATPSKATPGNWDGSIPWVSPKDMKVAQLSDAQDHVAETAVQGSLSMIPAGSLLIVVRGMILAHSFPTAESLVPVTINQDMKALVPHISATLPYLALLCKGMKPEILGLVDRSTHGTCKLESRKLFGMKLPLPPLAEQSRIVARVEELMRLCDALEAKGRLEATQHAQLVSTLLGALTDCRTPEELAEHWQRVATHFDLLLDRPDAVDALEQAILQLAVRGLLVPQDQADEPASVLLQRIRADKERLTGEKRLQRQTPVLPINPDELPHSLPPGWVWARFHQVADIASNLVAPASRATMWQVAPDCIEKGTGRLLEMRTVAQAKIISANHLFKPGQILYSKIRPSLSKAVLVDFSGLCSADMYPIESAVDSGYLLRYILSHSFLAQVRVAENRVKMPKLNQEALNAFLVAVPPLAEQFRIVARVDCLRRLCADLRQRLVAAQVAQSNLAEALVSQPAQ